jgi:hypothetical protein
MHDLCFYENYIRHSRDYNTGRFQAILTGEGSGIGTVTIDVLVLSQMLSLHWFQTPLCNSNYYQ